MIRRFRDSDCVLDSLRKVIDYVLGAIDCSEALVSRLAALITPFEIKSELLVWTFMTDILVLDPVRFVSFLLDRCECDPNHVARRWDWDGTFTLITPLHSVLKNALRGEESKIRVARLLLAKGAHPCIIYRLTGKEWILE